MSEFYLPVPYQLTMMENTWTKTQSFQGSIVINSAGLTLGYGIVNPFRPIVLALGGNTGSMGFDIYGNLEPINPSSGAAAQWIVRDNNNNPVLMIGLNSSYQYWQTRYTGVVNGIVVGQTPAATNPTIASGTVYQNTKSSYQTIDIPCYAATAGTAGTVAVAYGTSSTPSTIYTQYVSGSTSSTAQAVIHLRVPPQWYYELTATGVTLGTPSMVQE